MWKTTLLSSFIFPLLIPLILLFNFQNSKTLRHLQISKINQNEKLRSPAHLDPTGKAAIEVCYEIKLLLLR